MLLCGASREDKKSYRLHRRWEIGIFLLGFYRLCVTKDDRWVTIALTCFCFFLWYLLYVITAKYSCFGGADVRIMAGCMLALGAFEALYGIFIGYCMAACCQVSDALRKKRTKEIPLIPWMTAGIIVMEIFQKVFYFL